MVRKSQIQQNIAVEQESLWDEQLTDKKNK